MTGPEDHEVEKLVSDHLYLVQHIVHELAVRYPRHVDRQELWSAGALGLVEAAKRYRADGDVPFASYARPRIRGAILDSTRQRDWATRRVRRDQRQLTAAAARFQQQHQREATDADLAAVLGVSEEEVARRREAVHRGTVLHLDQPVRTSDGEVGALAETVPGDRVDESPAENLEQQELLGTLRTAVVHLNEVQREVIDRYYFRGDLLRDIAADLGVTEARVSQLRAEAVRSLQSYLDATAYETPAVDANAPGKRQRAAFVARVSENSTWRSRLDAASAAAWSVNTAATAG